jgi:DNA repair protein RadC
VGDLSDSELLALVVRHGTAGASAMDLSRTLISEFDGLPRLASRNVLELRRVRGMGPAKSVAVAAAFELGRRAASGAAPGKTPVSSPRDVARHFGPVMRHLKQEVFKVLLLDSANHLLRDVTISTGILNSSLVHPREVFQPAILEPAAGIILLHNHPSGNPEPSGEDIRITRQLAEAGRILGIPVHDHVIIADQQSTSFAERGLL